MKKISILIADDHPAFREGLACLLKDQTDLEVVATAGDGEEALEAAKNFQPEVAIMDISMPQMNGLEAAEQIRKICPGVAILMLSAYNYQAYMLGALRVGAMGYLPKNTPLNKLVSAVRMVLAGEAVFNLKALSQILSRSSSGRIEERKYIGELSPREIQVLKLVAKGTNNREIGYQLGIRERTVQTHVARILDKLGVNSRTAAVLHALKEGWLSPDDLMHAVDR